MLKSVLLVLLGTNVMCYRIIESAAPKPYTFQQFNTPNPNNWKYPWNPSSSLWQDKAHEPSGSPTNGPSLYQGESYIPSNISTVANLTSRLIETNETGQTNQTQKATVTENIANELSKNNNNQTRNNTKPDTESGTKTPPKYTTTPRPISGSFPVGTLGQLMAPAIQYHVGIYSKESTPYEQICGGSLVKADVVISAAHCFWSDDEGVRPAALYAVAAGKLLRDYDAIEDTYAQFSDIADIKVPPRFRGVATSFQDDIAILRLTTPLEYAPGVKPLCVDFDLALDREQLGNSRREGRVAGWGLTGRNGGPAQRLNFARMPTVPIESCLRDAEPAFLKYITSDKICAGFRGTGSALCRGDSGGGLVFLKYAMNNSVLYLRGIASTAPRDNNQCNIDAVATFTHIRSHMTFLTDHVPDISDVCRTVYNKTVTQAFVAPSEERNVPQVCQCPEIVEMMKNGDATPSFNATFNVKGGRIMLIWDSS